MIAGYGPARVPRSVRHPAADHRVNESMGGTEYLIASESVALEALGFTVLRDVAPREAIYVDQTGRFIRASARSTRSSIRASLIRLSRAAGLGHRRRLGLRGAIAHGWRAREERSPRFPKRRISTW